MKKFLVLVALVCALSACRHNNEPIRECPSCNPPVRHFEVVTECSDFVEKEMSDGSYTQCRYCVNKIYSEGIDVTSKFNKNTVQEGQPVRRPCGKKKCGCASCGQ